MTPRVIVVGLGPGGPDLVTAGALAAIAEVPDRFLRTTRHPAAVVVGDAESFDAVYEEADVLDDVYPTIVERLVDAAADQGEVLYAVPGSPLVAERTVELLRADPRVEVDIAPALSFVELAWARLGIDPVTAGVRLVDGQRFGVEAAGERGPLLVGQCDTLAVLSDIKLAVDEPPSEPVTVLWHLGLDDEAVFEVPWVDLDRSFEPDHLTSLYVPVLAAPAAHELARFDELVHTLRARCPWDAEQTHRSLRPHLLEEAYEVLDALDGLDEEAGEGYEHLEEELGDLLFQVLFHSVLAAEAGQFTIADVARTVHDKLRDRHPHVFGDVVAGDSQQVLTNWEQIKRAEKGRESVMDGIPAALPALLYALKVQKKAASQGVDAVPPIGAPLEEDGIGDALFALVDTARRLGVDPEMALRARAADFVAEYREGET